MKDYGYTSLLRKIVAAKEPFKGWLFFVLHAKDRILKAMVNVKDKVSQAAGKRKWKRFCYGIGCCAGNYAAVYVDFRRHKFYY